MGSAPVQTPHISKVQMQDTCSPQCPYSVASRGTGRNEGHVHVHHSDRRKHPAQAAEVLLAQLSCLTLPHLRATSIARFPHASHATDPWTQLQPATQFPPLVPNVPRRVAAAKRSEKPCSLPSGRQAADGVLPAGGHAAPSDASSWHLMRRLWPALAVHHAMQCRLIS